MKCSERESVCVREREWHYRQGEGRDYATICEWENQIK